MKTLSCGRKNILWRRGQRLPLAQIAAEIGVSTTILINWARDLKDGIDNLKAVELEVLYDKFYLSTGKKSNFLGLSRIREEIETRELSETRGLAVCDAPARLSKGTTRVVRVTFRDDDEVKVARGRRLPSAHEVYRAGTRNRACRKKLTNSL